MVANLDAQTPSEGVIDPQSINENGARDEESPLLPRSDTEPKVKPVTRVATIIAVLLLGEIIPHSLKHKILILDRRIHFQCRCDTRHGRCGPHFLRVQPTARCELAVDWIHIGSMRGTTDGEYLQYRKKVPC